MAGGSKRQLPRYVIQEQSGLHLSNRATNRQPGLQCQMGECAVARSAAQNLTQRLHMQIWDDGKSVQNLWPYLPDYDVPTHPRGLIL